MALTLTLTLTACHLFAMQRTMKVSGMLTALKGKGITRHGNLNPYANPNPNSNSNPNPNPNPNSNSNPYANPNPNPSLPPRLPTRARDAARFISQVRVCVCVCVCVRVRVCSGGSAEVTAPKFDALPTGG